MRVQGGKTFEPAQGGTRLTIQLEAGSPLGGLLGKLSGPLATRMLRQQIRADLARLKSVLEGRRMVVIEPGGAGGDSTNE